MDILDIVKLTNVFTTVGAALAAYLLTYFQNKFLNIKIHKEEREIAEEVKKVYTSFDDSKDDVLALMIKNVAELREYYTINKQQARSSFSAALFISVLGFILFASGVILSYYNNSNLNVIPYSTVAGTVVEIIAGLFFWLYSKAITQINIFHSSLQNTEKFLTAIQLVDKISDDKKDDVYKEIISKILDSNFPIQNN
jgi:hypothetical protein